MGKKIAFHYREPQKKSKIKELCIYYHLLFFVSDTAAQVFTARKESTYYQKYKILTVFITKCYTISSMCVKH